jgi:hypothetical protein
MREGEDEGGSPERPMKSTLPAVNGTPPRRGIVELILSLFLFILFSPISVFLG